MMGRSATILEDPSMANPEHLKILERGVDAWNEWRKEHPEIVPDLSEADLRRTYFGSSKKVLGG
jgi:hypothetical protein